MNSIFICVYLALLLGFVRGMLRKDDEKRANNLQQQKQTQKQTQQKQTHSKQKQVQQKQQGIGVTTTMHAHKPAASGVGTNDVNAHRYVCTQAEKQFQFDNADLVVTNICDTDTPWRLAQLALPEASVFLDIGGNRGYTSAMIFGLWSPGHDFNRKKLKEWTVNKGDEINQPDTVCGDGLLDDQPMVCPGVHKHQIIQGTYKCSFRRSIQVFAFDGQKSHVETVRKIVYMNCPLLHPNTSAKHSPGTAFGKQSLVKATWEYAHAALTSTANYNASGPYTWFSKADNEGGFVDVVGNKSSEQRLAKGLAAFNPDDFNRVPLTTIDLWAQKKNLRNIDVIKIDAENHDLEVVQGSFVSLKTRGVKFLTFECYSCSEEPSQKLFSVLDTKFGFDCYVNGEHDILIKITNCWDPAYAVESGNVATRPICKDNSCGSANLRLPNLRIDGNVYCAHRYRASALHALFESHSLYRYTPDGNVGAGGGTRHGHVISDALLSYPARFDEDNLVLPSENEGAWTRRTGRNPEDGSKNWW